MEYVIIWSQVQFGIKLHELIFQKGKCNFSFLKNSQMQINFKLNEKKTVWLLINNINMKKFTWKKCQKIFLEAIFSHSRESFFKVSIQNFCHCFTWYHWLRKFPIVFQQIRIQNYDVLFAPVLHFLLWSYT